MRFAFAVFVSAAVVVLRLCAGNENVELSTNVIKTVTLTWAGGTQDVSYWVDQYTNTVPYLDYRLGTYTGVATVWRCYGRETGVNGANYGAPFSGGAIPSADQWNNVQLASPDGPTNSRRWYLSPDSGHTLFAVAGVERGEYKEYLSAKDIHVSKTVSNTDSVTVFYQWFGWSPRIQNSLTYPVWERLGTPLAVPAGATQDLSLTLTGKYFRVDLWKVSDNVPMNVVASYRFSNGDVSPSGDTPSPTSIGGQPGGVGPGSTGANDVGYPVPPAGGETVGGNGGSVGTVVINGDAGSGSSGGLTVDDLNGIAVTPTTFDEIPSTVGPAQGVADAAAGVLPAADSIIARLPAPPALPSVSGSQWVYVIGPVDLPGFPGFGFDVDLTSMQEPILLMRGLIQACLTVLLFVAVVGRVRSAVAG